MAELTQAQLQAVKNEITNNPTLAAYAAAGGNADIKRYFDEPSNPAVLAWQPISNDELITAMDDAEIAAMQANDRETLMLLTQRSTHDPRIAGVRSALNRVVPTPNSRAAAIAAAQRTANRAEALLSAAINTIGGAKVLAWEGNLSLEDIRKARALA